MNNTPKKGDAKVVICEHTNQKVIQELIDDNYEAEGAWLCIHSNNTEDDVRYAEYFEKNGFVSEEFRNDTLS